MKTSKSEFENFNETMKDLLSVSHDEIKAKLTREKLAKNSKRKAKKPSSLDRVSREKD
jgi:hypothetical protein